MCAGALADFLKDFFHLANSGRRRNEALRVGVIGLGYFGERHARVYHRTQHVELVAVCDKDAGRATKLASELGAEP